MLGFADVKIIINKDMTKQELRDMVDTTDARTLSRLIAKGREFDIELKNYRNKLDAEKEKIIQLLTVNAQKETINQSLTVIAGSYCDCWFFSRFCRPLPREYFVDC